MNRVKTITNKDAEGVYFWLFDRYKILFALMLQTGIRVSDALKLRVKDVNRIMDITESKTKKVRTVSVDEKLYKNLRQLCDGKSDSAYVFHSARNASKHIHRTTLHRQLKKALTWLKIDCSAHSARKLYAYNVFRETGSIEAVQKALNHKYITTTATYLDIDLQKLLKEVKPC